MAPAYRDQWVEDILAVHDELDVPEGHKAEVIEGNIVVSPSPSRRHGLISWLLQAQISGHLPTGLVPTNNITVDLTATGERYIPDLLVVDEDALRSDEWLLPVSDAELVVEIVSPSSARDDRVSKVRGYAASGVPIYLLVDPLERAITLFTEPSGKCYQQVHRVAFGKPITLPAPYDVTIDSSGFGI